MWMDENVLTMVSTEIVRKLNLFDGVYFEAMVNVGSIDIKNTYFS